MASCDFFIFYSEFDTGRKEYTCFLLRENFGEHLGPYFLASREQVIGAMKNGFIFDMYLPCLEGQAKQLVRLYLMSIAGKDYIRTDQVEIDADN
jgi:hypothetical protein